MDDQSQESESHHKRHESSPFECHLAAMGRGPEQGPLVLAFNCG